MKDIQLSIIIPVYNVEDYLAECLDSVFSQRLEKCEVICVNDGSPDHSRNILADYQKKFPDMVIVDRENGGLSAARNSGLEVAQGEYIYFLDSDDYLYPEVLKKMLLYAKSKDLDLCLFNALKDGREQYFNMKTAIQEALSGAEFYKQCYETNGFFPPSSVWMYLYNRKFFSDNNLCFKEGIVHEDEEFTPRAFYFSKRVSYLDIPIQYHRKLREGSLTASTLISFNKKHIGDLLQTSSDLYLFFSTKKNIRVFNLKIFEIYLAMARLICRNNARSKRELFSKSHFAIMKQCALSWKRYLLYFLFRHQHGLFVWYESNNKPKLLRTGINLIAIIFYRYYFGEKNPENAE